jgi:hypothetical protein
MTRDDGRLQSVLQQLVHKYIDLDCHLILLAPEAASLTEPGLSSGRHAQHGVAARADNDGLRVAEHGGDREASLALDIHEVRVGALYQPLQLVATLLEFRGRVQQVDIARKNL